MAEPTAFSTLYPALRESIPTHLVANISHQNEERADKRSDLPRQRNIHRELLYGWIGSKLRHDPCHRD